MAFLGDRAAHPAGLAALEPHLGGNHNIGIALYNGGSLYIDDGKPTPAGLARTVRNLREISPTVYFNVPKGLEEIAKTMDHDAELRASASSAA